MNGRVYDPVIGRFLSADPIVQAPTFSQSYNRYSYVLNNPLSFTDPSGYMAGGAPDCEFLTTFDCPFFDRESWRISAFNDGPILALNDYSESRNPETRKNEPVPLTMGDVNNFQREMDARVMQVQAVAQASFTNGGIPLLAQAGGTTNTGQAVSTAIGDTFIFIGGLNDDGSTIVSSYVQNSFVSPANATVQYFYWNQSDEILDFIETKATGRVNIIGHSFGGDTGMIVTERSSKPINVLVTIDPVYNFSHPRTTKGYGKSAKRVLKEIKTTNAAVFVNVLAQSSSPDGSDFIAGAGGRIRIPATITLDFNHDQFRSLFTTAPSGGSSALDILLKNN